nr:hypothetical protein [uncultured Capnocytophaga sp.]
MEDGNTVGVRIDPAVQREVSLEQSDEVPNAHKEKIPTDKIRNGNYRDRHAKDLMIMESLSTQIVMKILEEPIYQ